MSNDKINLDKYPAEFADTAKALKSFYVLVYSYIHKLNPNYVFSIKFFTVYKRPLNNLTSYTAFNKCLDKWGYRYAKRLTDDFSEEELSKSIKCYYNSNIVVNLWQDIRNYISVEKNPTGMELLEACNYLQQYSELYENPHIDDVIFDLEKAYDTYNC